MLSQSASHQINNEVTFLDSAQSPLVVCAVNLTFTTKNNELLDCRLTLQVTPQLYNRIETEELFNLKPGIYNFEQVNFLHDTNITIETK
ncbi:hypothetical protein [Nostoc sp. MS1]|uniref:hypothetical protein n=1 Tax=Nostoc sp. MS1 TaxID=2764711 RepID=UPI001CC517D1|nr:hypothetical protein [Nostoc sp. MS1]BCL35124.1 hypothetical protein NSMS1_15710 [Nostoc sp. MS1]